MSDARPSLPADGRINDGGKRTAIILWALVAYAIIRSFFAAASKPFWYDEFCTMIVSRQRTISAIWKALAQPADSQGPPFYLLERAAATLLHNPHIGLRLPAICAFACTLVCVFFFVKRRCGALYALLCTSMLLLTVAFTTYAVEARSYSLLVACIALALFCYQRAPEPLWLVLMGFSLTAAEAFHYYAVFAFAPFGLAEITLYLNTRRLRLGVWLAMVCGLVPLAVFWPLLLAQKRYYGPHFWAVPTLRHAGSTYGWLFHISSHHWNLAIALAVVLFLLGVPAALAIRRVRAALIRDRYFHEYVLLWALLSLPFVAYAATKLTHGGFDHKYVLESVLAVPLGAGYILPRLNRKITLLLAILLLSILAVQEASFWASQRGHLGKVISPAAPLEGVVDLAGHTDLPVVVSDTLDYLSFAYYAPPSLATRLVAVVDPLEEAAYVGTDSLDRNLVKVQSLYPLRVYEFQAFAHDHPSFLLYSDGTTNDWWPRRLARDGYSLEVASEEEGRKVYLVTRKGSSP
jgi:4-amino-4-deoxy-L-arabinose transferase-like glycosyltransferase